MGKEMVQAHSLVYEYKKYDEEGRETDAARAVDQVSLQIQKGEFVAILGHNGSGKSTLAKHMNAILTPTGGTMWVDGKDTREEEHLWEIRQRAGMVFQNPDNQIIGTIVEEDVGFGPENMGVPTREIWERVEESLKAVNMLKYRHHSPNKLSGGQKQRVAIAGVVAMHPQCIVLDEPTAMLDPNGRKEVIRAVRALNQVEEITVILITHYMEEVIYADKVIVMDQGRVVMEGTPREIFSQVELLKSYRLDVPQATLVAYELKKAGMDLPDGILTREELVEALCRTAAQSSERQIINAAVKDTDSSSFCQKDEQAPAAHKLPGAIKLEHVNYVYGSGTAYEIHALKDINLELGGGEFVGLIGHTGSGKSTLVQHLNGLVKATDGHIYFHGEDIYGAGYDMRRLRSRVGLVFQYPEHQLFEVDVLSDVCFGPKNQGLSKEEAQKRAKAALEMVGLGEEFYYQSPFELSGGQKRRAAIAGVLAMEPEILVLDEPTAGLDPKGRDEILDQISKLHREKKITIVLVSHSMEDVAKYVERIIVMNQGEVLFDDVPREVFRHYKELEQIGLAAPQVTYIMHALKEKGLPVDEDATTVWEAQRTVLEALAGLKS
ncbi:MAG: energy-coupling factor transporter ATPase [Lachnospiraceae bacterium]|nr:energy-coupling factor transporter ATPase [Lachnospiraceae bacterium]